ncbi:MAG: DNA-binding protein WhiA [Oscillospiraceae bacterium]|nr:DNA-binding protein WhiA [Candidatus Limimonas coprohippi]MCQ2487968.1 DNA-binding protein WhiA [Clostridia bacterium]
MSFASDVKDELIEKSELARAMGGMKECCIHAEMYGIFLFCRDFSSTNISIKTENQSVALMFANYAESITGKSYTLEQTSSGKYRVNIKKADERRQILEHFGHTGQEVNRRMYRSNLEDDCCLAALLRGAFLSCGTITDPEKDYHLEFVMSHKVLSNDLLKLITEIHLPLEDGSIDYNKNEFDPKYILRRGVHVVYFKDSESIENVLTFMGAPDASLEVMGIRMYKDMRNRVNRKMNFENANAGRAFDAAYRQIEAIRFIEEEKGLGFLPDELRELAQLRLENSDFTLSDLADNLKEPISKSGVNHRLKKILEMAEGLGWKG